jgi:hypothetical protein
MDAFEFIRSKLADEQTRYAGGAASTIVGTAICRALAHEAVLEDRMAREGRPRRNDQELLTASLQYVEQNWPDEMASAHALVEQRASALLEDHLKKAIEYYLEDAERQQRPILFAIWTGVAANTVWLLLGAAVLLAILIGTGNSLEDAMSNILSKD